ncbi:cytochrome P450 [Lyophyllum atratum]|nr:cytochrome P450 [Lyophyllum atratum]
MPLDLLRHAAQEFISIHPRFLGHDVPLLAILLSLFVLSRVVKLFNGLSAVGYLQGYRIPFQGAALPGALFPTSWWNLGLHAHWRWRSTLYKDFGADTFSVVPFLVGLPSIYTSNLDVMRQVVSGEQRTSFRKSKESNQVLIKWGHNLASASDMDMWRRHRRVMGPAFNNKLYQMVWSETLDTYRQMESVEGWVGKSSIEIPAVQKLSTKMALLVIAKCGFGFDFDWSAPPTGPDGKMTIQEAVRILADSHAIALMMPDWVRYLPMPGFSKIREAFNEFSAFMRKEIDVRTAEVRNEEQSADERTDAFTMLVRANEREAKKLRLDDQEVIGNVFILLFTGHETSAHTISATLALLALHQEIQDEILEQIVSVVGYDRNPVYDDYSNLDKVLSAFYEALRLFPSAHIMVREASEDTILNLPSSDGQEGTTPLPVHKGTNVSIPKIVMDMVGIHYSSRYFKDPEEFRPSRFYGTPNESEALSAFGIGPRACVGRKFATTEAVAFLTMLLRDWRVEPKLETGETRGAWREKVLARPTLGITLSVGQAPVRLTKRGKGRD